MKKLILFAFIAFAMIGCSTADGVAKDLGLRDVEINELNDDILSLKLQILVLETNINTLEEEVEKLNAEVVTAENALILDGYTDTIAHLQEQLDEKESELEEIDR